MKIVTILLFNAEADRCSNQLKPTLGSNLVRLTDKDVYCTYLPPNKCAQQRSESFGDVRPNKRDAVTEMK